MFTNHSTHDYHKNRNESSSIMRIARAGSDFLPRASRPMKKKPDGLASSASLVQDIEELSIKESLNGFTNLDDSEIYEAQSLGRD